MNWNIQCDAFFFEKHCWRTIIFKISLKIIKNSISKDTLIKKRLYLNNNGNFIEDYNAWAIERPK